DLTAAIAEAFHGPVPADLSLPAQPSNDLLGPTNLSHRQPDLSPSRVLQGTQQSQLPLVTASLSQPSPVSAVKPSPIPTSPPPVRSKRTRKGKLIAWFVVLLVLASSIIVSLIVFAIPSLVGTLTFAGTLTFTNSGQYDP